MKRWRDVATRFRRPLAYATSIRYLPSMFGETKLLTTAIAAQTLHRIRFDTKEISDNAYPAIGEAMLANVDPEHRDHLRLQLQHANQHTLGKRLRQLAKFTKPASTNVVGDPGVWAQTVVNVRNELTHPGDISNQAPPPTGADLLYLSESAYVLVVLTVLRSRPA